MTERLEADSPREDMPCNSGNTTTVNDFLFIEVFAGCARLSSVVRELGLQALPFDSKHNRHDSLVRCIALDLTKSDHQLIVLQIVRDEKVAAVHMAPPCGTSSRAREKPLPQHLTRQGVPQPRPLRSAAWPKGLPGLTTSEQERVDAANELYDFCVMLALECFDRKIPFSIENPSRSWAWDVMESFSHEYDRQSFWTSLPEVHFQHCMYGSKRDKWTKFLFWPAGFLDAMEAVCDGSHVHEAWGVKFATGKWEFQTMHEAEYPLELCRKYAALLSNKLQSEGVTMQPLQLNGHISGEAKKYCGRIATGREPKGRKLPPIVPEFDRILTVSSLEGLPKHKILRQSSKGGDSGSQLESIIGVYADPVEYTNKALEATHPMDMISGLADETKETIFFMLTQGPETLARSRSQNAVAIMRKLESLKEQQSRDYEMLPPHLKKILKGKNYLLFKQLLEENEYADSKIADEYIKGFTITGKLIPSGIWDRKLVPATMSLKEFESNSPWRNAALKANCVSSGDQQVDLVLWEQTLAEVSSGWLDGPFKASQLTELFKTEKWVASRRFPIHQSGKIRLIDDAKESCLNSTITAVEKLQLMDTDNMVELAMVTTSAAKSGRCEFHLRSGKVLSGQVHGGWTQNLDLQGKTLDMKSAYKQLGHSLESLKHAVIMAFDPTEQTAKYFVSNAFLFGSTASVYIFNRLARAIWFLLNKVMKVMALQFYDDFPLLEPKATAASAQAAAEFLFQALGFEYAREGHKYLPFAEIFAMLGVQVDLLGLNQGILVIGNKPSRIADLVLQIEAILADKKLPAAQAASLRGKLQFAQGQYLGRSLKLALVALDLHLSGKNSKLWSDQLSLALTFAKELLSTAAPRRVSLIDTTAPIIVFTDGAFESLPDGSFLASIGAVVIDPVTNTRSIHDGMVPNDLVALWQKIVGAQLIGQVELYPILAIRLLYQELLENRRVLYFIDNDSARDALISGTSKSLASMTLLTEFHLVESLKPSYPWYARVPSSSNPADAPSRGDVDSMAKSLCLEYKGPLFCKDDVVQRLLASATFESLLEKSRPT
jgi:hypothetical protein